MTDDEREDLMVTMMQDDLAHGRTGQTMSRYRENATAILAAGFHRSNPQRERSDALTLEQIKWDYQTLARNEQGKPAWQSGAEFDTCLAAHDAQVRSGSNRGVPSEALDLDALEALARAATTGPWILDGMGEDEPEINYWAHRFIGTDLPQADGMHQIIATSEDGHGPNAEYIAAADPQTVLALITALRAAGEVR